MFVFIEYWQLTVNDFFVLRSTTVDLTLLQYQEHCRRRCRWFGRCPASSLHVASTWPTTRTTNLHDAVTTHLASVHWMWQAVFGYDLAKFRGHVSCQCAEEHSALTTTRNRADDPGLFTDPSWRHERNSFVAASTNTGKRHWPVAMRRNCEERAIVQWNHGGNPSDSNGECRRTKQDPVCWATGRIGPESRPGCQGLTAAPPTASPTAGRREDNARHGVAVMDLYNSCFKATRLSYWNRALFAIIGSFLKKEKRKNMVAGWLIHDWNSFSDEIAFENVTITWAAILIDGRPLIKHVK